MSLLYNARWQAFDNSGNPLVGATLTVYNAGGVVLASIWRDAALTIAMTNPTSGTDKSDAAGRFGQIFTAEGAIFDVLLKDALGNTVASYVNVVSLGSNTGALSRDFITSRFQARGAGGTTFIEVGDPTGDDVGGTGQIGGWLGTQADLITVNAAQFNVVGRIKENGKKLASTVYTEATAFTTAATVDITLPNDPTGVLAWEIEIWDYTQSANANIYARLSYDNGANYKAGATDYISQVGLMTAASTAGTADLTEAQMTLAVDGQTNSADLLLAGTVKIITPPSGTKATRVTSWLSGVAHTGVLAQSFANAYGKGGYGKATNLRLFAASGTITGKYLVRPLRGYGDA